VELAVDYVKADPGLFGRNGKGDRIVRAFCYPWITSSLPKPGTMSCSWKSCKPPQHLAGEAEVEIGDDTLALLLKRVSATPWRARWIGPKNPTMPISSWPV
jgi:hypothetical protein